MNEKLSAKDVAKLFGVSYGTFRNRKDYYLMILSQCYVWHMDGRAYILEEKKCELPVIQKGKYKYNADQVENYYENMFDKMLDIAGKNGVRGNYSSIARDIRDEKSFPYAAQHTYKTGARYISNIYNRREDIFINEDEDMWLRQSVGEDIEFGDEVSKEDLREWGSLLNSFTIKGSVIQAAIDADNGLISKEESNKQVKNEIERIKKEALEKWFSTHNYIPVKTHKFYKRGERAW